MAKRRKGVRRPVVAICVRGGPTQPNVAQERSIANATNAQERALQRQLEQVLQENEEIKKQSAEIRSKVKQIESKLRRDDVQEEIEGYAEQYIEKKKKMTAIYRRGAHEASKRLQEPSENTQRPWTMCEQCSGVFGTGQHIPRIMNCGHTFCQPCLETHVDDFGLQCPICDEIFPETNMERIAKNFLINSN